MQEWVIKALVIHMMTLMTMITIAIVEYQHKHIEKEVRRVRRAACEVFFLFHAAAPHPCDQIIHRPRSNF